MEWAMSIFVAEFIGTLLLILLGNGVVANVLLTRSKGFHSGWMVISAGWGFAVVVAVYVTGWISGGHLNPAITLGLSIAGKSPWHLVPYYLSGQMLGAISGSALVYLAYYSHWKPTSDANQKLLCFCTNPAIRATPWNFVTEMIGTAVLVLGVLGIINIHNGVSNGFGPYAIGILVFSIGLSLGGPTGYAINPARDLGPRIAHALLPIAGKGPSEWGYAWVPVIAPLVGACLGTWIYLKFIVNMLPLVGGGNTP
jgi:glycerol uptake facilitator protein